MIISLAEGNPSTRRRVVEVMDRVDDSDLASVWWMEVVTEDQLRTEVLEAVHKLERQWIDEHEDRHDAWNPDKLVDALLSVIIGQQA